MPIHILDIINLGKNLIVITNLYCIKNNCAKSLQILKLQAKLVINR